MEFKLVENKEDMDLITLMSSVIWPIAYKEILDPKQINYMINKFLSYEAIKTNISDGYTYVIMYNEAKERIGFMAYKVNNDYIFLSKLYILPNYQNLGYASEAINYLKGFKLDIELTVNKYNQNAYDKYIHLGFKNIDSVVSDIGNGYVMDDYIMRFKA